MGGKKQVFHKCFLCERLVHDSFLGDFRTYEYNVRACKDCQRDIIFFKPKTRLEVFPEIVSFFEGLDIYWKDNDD